MRWFVIMLPFIAIFVFFGIRWSIYSEQMNVTRSYIENSSYTSVNYDNLREYNVDVFDKDLIYQALKYISVSNKYNEDFNIKLSIVNEYPPVIKVEFTQYLNGKEVSTINRYLTVDTKL